MRIDGGEWVRRMGGRGDGGGWGLGGGGYKIKNWYSVFLNKYKK